MTAQLISDLVILTSIGAFIAIGAYLVWEYFNKHYEKERRDHFPDDSTELIERGLFGDDDE